MEIGGHFIKRKVMLIPTYKAEPTECTVELDFEVDRALKVMAERAWNSKGKRSKFGFVKVKVRAVDDYPVAKL